MKRLPQMLILLFLPFWLLGNTKGLATADQPIIIIKVQVQNPIGDIAQLKTLMDGVGYDFEPQDAIAGKLKEVGIKRIRLINVDNQTEIVGTELKAPLLDAKLEWCRRHKFIPHIIIGQFIPRWLSSHKGDINFGPKDYRAYEDYLRIFFKHVIFQKGFADATWEVANEPDCGGAPVPRSPRSRKPGSEEDYQGYLLLYRSVAKVAQQLEAEHPGIKILLGGPASCGAATYPATSFDFNWHERFLRDVAKMGLKLDFFSFHYYGNMSQLGRRSNLTQKPSFEEMMRQLRHWISLYKPHTPVWITEWGYSWLIHKNPTAALLNGTNVGAAWSTAFIDAMFNTVVAKSFLLCSTDKADEWTWPALFHDGSPKPLFYVYRLLHRLSGRLVRVQGGSEAVGALAAEDRNVFKVILWNYDWQRGRLDKGQEKAKMEKISLLISQLPKQPDRYKINLVQISEDYVNPYFKDIPGKQGILEPRQQSLEEIKCLNGILNINLSMPPSSVNLLVISRLP